ncbi:MAG: ATP-grasp domain-containing protein, partial [bacterium]
VKYLNSQNAQVHVLSNRLPSYFDAGEFVFEQIDVQNKDSILDYCRLHQIELIYSVGSDFGLLTSSYVSEQLGLKHFIPWQTAVLFQNKKLFRQFITKQNISLVQYKSSNKLVDFENWNIFPSVVKPADSQGQRGVSIINKKDEFRESFKKALSYSSINEVIVEEYIPGEEISVNVFINEGRIDDFFITDRILAQEINSGIPKRHIIPSSMPGNLISKIYSITQKIIENTGINNGPVYLQMKYHKDQVEIIEAAARLDGCHLWRLIEMYSGVNLLQKTIDKLLNKNNSSKTQEAETGKKMFIEFSLQKPGEDFVEEFLPSKYRIPYYKIGETVTPVNGAFEKTIVHFCSEQ